MCERGSIPFKLDAKEYLSIEYLVKDTRDDLYRKFAYLYRDAKQGYVPDTRTTKPSTLKTKDVAAVNTAKLLDGPKLARVAYLKQAFPQWQLHEHDFISDKDASFALFDGSKAQQCYMVTEAGNNPVVTNQVDFSAGARCAGVLASSRLEKSGVTYYMGLLKLTNGAQSPVLTSSARMAQSASKENWPNVSIGAARTRTSKL